MKVAWLAVNASYAHASLALPLLHVAVGARIQVDWSVVQVGLKDDVGSVAAAVAGSQPDVVAATLYLFNRRFVLDVLCRVKALLPDALVIVGGPECLGENESLLRRFPSVDVAVRGEGEDVFRGWLEAVAAGDGDWRELAGVCRLDDDGVYHDSGRAPLVTDLSEMPSPYESCFFDWSKPFVQLETSRGCSQTCSFCTSGGDDPVRRLPVSGVRQLLTEVRRHGVTEVRVLDRTFNAEPRRCVALLRLFREEFADIRFHVEIHPEFLSAGIRAELVAALPGRLHVEAGLQTSAVGALAAVKRTAGAARALDGIRFLCGAENLEVHVDLLGGLPAQTLEDVLADLTELTRCAPDEIQLELLKVLPGTPLVHDAAGLGLAFSPEPPYEVLRTPQMSVEDMTAVRDLSVLVDLFYNQPSLQSCVRDAMAVNADFYRAFLEFLRTENGLSGRPGLQRRFRLFYEWARSRHSALAETLAVEWLACGLSPLHGLVPATRWTADIPGDAVQSSGEELDALEGKKLRMWHLRLSGEEHWFVFAGGQAAGQGARAVFSRRC